jgi:hypothetical protein
MQAILSDLQGKPTDNPYAFTVCQHIYFHKIIPILKKMGIKYLFTPHAKKGQEIMDGIHIKSFPLYPVHAITTNADQQKKIWYSFVGSYNPNVYISKVRQEIYTMPHSQDAVVHRTNEWHFEKEVYHEQIHGKQVSERYKEFLDTQRRQYQSILANSRFSLCPSGSGPSSIRLWESMAAGAIPVILSDTLELPLEDQINWNDCSVRIPEEYIRDLPKILESISPENETTLRENCLKVFNTLCGIYGTSMLTTIKYTFANIILGKNEIAQDLTQPFIHVVMEYPAHATADVVVADASEVVDKCILTNLDNPFVKSVHVLRTEQTTIERSEQFAAHHKYSEHVVQHGGFVDLTQYANQQFAKARQFVAVVQSDVFLSYDDPWDAAGSLIDHENIVLTLSSYLLDENSQATAQEYPVPNVWLFRAPLMVSIDEENGVIEYLDQPVNDQNSFKTFKLGLTQRLNSTENTRWSSENSIPVFDPSNLSLDKFAAELGLSDLDKYRVMWGIKTHYTQPLKK